VAAPSRRAVGPDDESFRTDRRGVPMAPAISPFFFDPSFDPFLFAKIGDEADGTLLSVLSALARLDLDPWREAASLSNLPAPAATERLTSLLSSLPSSQLPAPTPAAIARLIGLLPRAAWDRPSSRSVVIVAKSKLGWPLVIIVIAALMMLSAEQLAQWRGFAAPTGGGGSPTISAPNPGATKAPRG
jgi:hypothetical protein